MTVALRLKSTQSANAHAHLSWRIWISQDTRVKQKVISASFAISKPCRLQNSPYFCVFKYVRAVKKRSRTRLKTESETRERLFSLASHALPAYEARALRARKTLTPRFTDFFTDFEKKPTVLQSKTLWSRGWIASQNRDYQPLVILMRPLNCLVPWRIHRQNFLLKA